MKLGRHILNTENDPDETLQFAITKKELGTILFGLHFVHRMFPEHSEDIEALCAKIVEISEAQNFLDFNGGED